MYKPKYQIGYKAVQVDDSEYYEGVYCSFMFKPESNSCVSYLDNGRYTTRKPECGPLALFSNPFSAFQFAVVNAVGSFPYEIWECHYYESNDTTLWTPTLGVRTKDNIPHTILANRIKLSKKLAEYFWSGRTKTKGDFETKDGVQIAIHDQNILSNEDVLRILWSLQHGKIR